EARRGLLLHHPGAGERPGGRLHRGGLRGLPARLAAREAGGATGFAARFDTPGRPGAPPRTKPPLNAAQTEVAPPLLHLVALARAAARGVGHVAGLAVAHGGGRPRVRAAPPDRRMAVAAAHLHPRPRRG